MKRLSILPPRLNRKLILMLASIVAVAIVAYLTYGWLAWNNYQDRYKKYERESKSALDAAMGRKLSKEYSAEDKLADIKRQAQQIKQTSSDQCTVPVAAGWMMILGDRSRQVDMCKESMEDLGKQAGQLYEKMVNIEVENQLAKIIQKAAASSKDAVTSDKWQAAQAAWATAADKASKISVTTSAAKVLKKQAQSRLDQLATAWNQLIEANEAKDEDKFIQASEQLRAGYTELLTLVK